MKRRKRYFDWFLWAELPSGERKDYAFKNMNDMLEFIRNNEVITRTVYKRER